MTNEQFVNDGKLKFTEEKSPGKRDRRSALWYSKDEHLYIKLEHFIKHLMETALEVHDTKKGYCTLGFRNRLIICSQRNYREEHRTEDTQVSSCFH